MGDLGSIGWRVFEKFLLEQGCLLKRTKGDHHIYVKPGLQRPLVVPRCDPLPSFIILNNLRVLGSTKQDLLKYLER